MVKIGMKWGYVPALLDPNKFAVPCYQWQLQGIWQIKQEKFVAYYVAEGKSQTEAARLAGYRFPENEGYRLFRQLRMIQLIRAARQKFYQMDLANVAITTLQQIMQDPNAPASARVSAARTALGLAGNLGPNKGDGS